MQIHVTYDDVDGMIWMNCQQCNAELKMNVPAFVAAINHVKRFECPDCKCDFSLDLHCLIRQPEQGNDAETGIREVSYADPFTNYLYHRATKALSNVLRKLLS